MQSSPHAAAKHLKREKRPDGQRGPAGSLLAENEGVHVDGQHDPGDYGHDVDSHHQRSGPFLGSEGCEREGERTGSGDSRRAADEPGNICLSAACGAPEVDS